MDDLERLGAEAVEHLRALIRFDTTNPPGNELPAAQYVAEVLGAVGLETEVVDFGSNRGSCVARLRGSGARRPLLLLSHVDVVPAETDKWTHPPFGADLADGCIYGRGALDDKVATAIHIAIALRAARERLPLQRDLIVAATSGEEDGGPGMRFNGAHRLATERPDLIDAEYGISEGGGWAYVIEGRPFYTCQVGERGNWPVNVIARGSPGHAAVPPREHAILRLTRALNRLGDRSLPLRVTEAARAFFEEAAKSTSPETSRLLADLLLPESHERAMAMLPADQQTKLSFHSMLHSTATPTVIEGGYKNNVIPSEARAQLNVRPLPDVDQATIAAELRECLGDDVEMQSTYFRTGIQFPMQTPLFDALAAALARHDSSGVMLPALLPGGTDACRLDRSRLTIYGFQPLRARPGPVSGPDWSQLMHGHDERIAVDDVHFAAAVLYDAVKIIGC